MPHKTTPQRLRPLLARPGAVFRCLGDGLCCTDIHVLGVLTRSEVRELRQRNKLSVIYSDEIEGHCLKPIDHGCLFLGAEKLCSLHAQHGAAAKPVGCRRFPYGLVSTPVGGRITTEHRCTCRTLGDRPPLSIEDADASLRDRSGRLEVDEDAPPQIRMGHRKRVPFAVYAAIEADMIARLNAGERAEQVLAARPLPELAEGAWVNVAAEHIACRDDSAGGEAFAWFGDGLLELAAGHTPPQRGRPWRAAFERAVSRPGPPNTAEKVYNDWVADEIWGFGWLQWGPFDVARAELATRLAVARVIARHIQADGAREDQAAAEAVMVCELISEGNEWPRAVGTILTVPSPADALNLPDMAQRRPA
ncbi:MAG TPA: hypothetical protein VJR89_18425 [Polyangiales bacterium]|nr:hypothetical protein [Polyangiales bacterium]